MKYSFFARFFLIAVSLVSQVQSMIRKSPIIHSILKKTYKKRQFRSTSSHKKFKVKRRFYQTRGSRFKKRTFRAFEILANVGAGILYFFPIPMLAAIGQWYKTHKREPIMSKNKDNIQYQVLQELGIKTYFDLFNHIEMTVGIVLDERDKQRIKSTFETLLAEENVIHGLTAISSILLLPSLVYMYQTDQNNIPEDYIPRLTSLTFFPVLYNGTQNNPLVFIWKHMKKNIKDIPSPLFSEFQVYVADPISKLSDIREDRKDRFAKELWDLLQQKKYKYYFLTKDLLVIQNDLKTGESLFVLSDEQKKLLHHVTEKPEEEKRQEALTFSEMTLRLKPQRLFFPPPSRDVTVIPNKSVAVSLQKTWSTGLVSDVMELIANYQE